MDVSFRPGINEMTIEMMERKEPIKRMFTPTIDTARYAFYNAVARKSIEGIDKIFFIP